MYRYLEDKLNVETKKTSGDKFTQIRLLKEDIEFSARLINARGDDLEKAVREQNVYNPSYVTPGKVEETVADMVAQDRSEREYLIVAETGNSTARTKAEQARAKWRRDTLDILAFGGNDRIPCPHGCSGRGKCVHGLCECKEGWHTADCSERSCLEIVVAMVVVRMAYVSAKSNGLDHIALSNRHQNAKKPVLHPAKRMPQRAMKVPILDKFVSRIVLRRIVTLKNSTFVVFHQWKRW